MGSAKQPVRRSVRSSPRLRHVGKRRKTETAFCGMIGGGRPLFESEGQHHHPEVMDSRGYPTGMCAHGHRIPLYCNFPVFVGEVGEQTYVSRGAPRMALATKAKRRSKSHIRELSG